jgi:molecular chaperone DnaK (HSP70)
VKRELSRQITAELAIDDLIESPTRIALRQSFERATFEGLCQDLFQRSQVVSAEALESIGLGPRDITQVVAIGGISRIPFVRRALGRFFGREILHVVNPDEAVALGAGLCAAEMAQHAVVGCAVGATA